MAKLLLLCDYYLYSNNGKYYFKDKNASKFYDRYLRVFDEIRIVNRVIEEIDLNENRYPINDPRIEIYPLPIFHGPIEHLKKYNKVGSVLSKATEGCDAAILRLPCTAAQRIGRSIIKKKIPYAVEIVFDAYDGAKTGKNIVERILWFLIDRKMRKISRSADGVSCVTQFYLQQRYFSLKLDHFESYYSSAGLPLAFYTSERQYPKGKTINIAHVDLQIGLHSRKGTDEVLKAAAILKKQGVIVNIGFAGDDWGDNKKKIIQYATKLGVDSQVFFPGFLSMDQMSDFLDNSDVFVFPTKAEGLPRCVIEAMAKGLPVVSTPVSGIPELLDMQYLVDYADVAALAEKIKQIITNKEVYEAASRSNFCKALEYEASVLQLRRDEFYKNLRSLVK